MARFASVFLSQEDVELILGLPWVKGRGQLLLQKWQGGFNPLKESPSHNIIWEKLLGLPFELWEHSTISDIVNCINTFYFWDEGSIGQLDKKISQVLIEDTCGSGLLSMLELLWGSFTQRMNIDYWGIPYRCLVCHLSGDLLQPV